MVKNIFYIAIIMLLIKCSNNSSFNINKFKNNYKKANIDTIKGNFISFYKEGDSRMILKFTNETKYKIEIYSSLKPSFGDTIVINNAEYSLNTKQLYIKDSTINNISLYPVFTSIYKIKGSNNKKYLIIDSPIGGAAGRAINIRCFVVFYIENDSIVNYKVFSSWFGDSHNFIENEKGELEFIKITPFTFANPNSDSCLYEISFINIKTLIERKEKYKMLETYDYKKHKYSYQFDKYNQ